MKKILLFFLVLIFILYLLLCPADTFTAARSGLILWYEQLLPTLLPFTIMSNLVMSSGYAQILVRPIATVIQKVVPISDNGIFVLFSGFLFGFPIGSKNCAELYKQGNLSDEEAKILFLISNNMSPAFVNGFVLTKILHMPQQLFLSYGLLYGIPLLFGLILLKLKVKTTNIHKKTASRSQMNFKIIDAGIMNGFETLTRLGGYIMLFSIGTSMLYKIPLSPKYRLILIGLTEITNGIHLIPHTIYEKKLQYTYAMAFTAFGGLSGIVQTSAMIQGSKLSIVTYSIAKLSFTLFIMILIQHIR